MELIIESLDVESNEWVVIGCLNFKECSKDQFFKKHLDLLPFDVTINKYVIKVAIDCLVIDILN